MVSEKFEIADALDREIETVWRVIAALQWILTEHGGEPYIMRGDDSLSLISFRDEQEIGIAGGHIKADYFAARCLNHLPHSRFAILWCA